MNRRWMMGLLMVLCGAGLWASPALGGVAPGTTIRREMAVRPPSGLKAEISPPNTIVLTWKAGRPLLTSMWVVAEEQDNYGHWNTLNLPGMYLPTDATRFEHRGIKPSTRYRYQVCGDLQEQSAPGGGVRYCSERVTPTTEVWATPKMVEPAYGTTTRQDAVVRPPSDLKVEFTSPDTVLLTWRAATGLTTMWIGRESQDDHGHWDYLGGAPYIRTDATRYEDSRLSPSTAYRFQVCGKSQGQSAPGDATNYCTEKVTIRTPRALSERLGVAAGFVIGTPVPDGGGFQGCTGLSGYVGQLSGGTLIPWTWANSLCAPGTVTVSRETRLANMSGKRIRLVVTQQALDGTSSKVIENSQADVYELAFPSGNSVTFHVALASGIGAAYWGKETFEGHFRTGAPVKMEVQYEGNAYTTLSCTYASSPPRMSCP